jgi:hypothetical protein
VQAGAHQTERLVELVLVPASTVGPSQADTLAKEPAHMQSGGHDARLLVGNVVLQAGAGINGQLHALIDRAPEPAVVLCGVEVVGIVLGVVDVVLGAVAAQAVCGDLELARAIAKGHEAQDPEKDADGFGGDVLDGADIDCLSWRICVS